MLVAGGMSLDVAASANGFISVSSSPLDVMFLGVGRDIEAVSYGLSGSMQAAAAVLDQTI